MNTFLKKAKRIAAIMLLSAILTTVVNAQQIWYVTMTGSGIQNGSSWQNAASGLMLQTIIDQVYASQGGQIWVATGIYQPPSINNGFELRRGVELYGGFAGWETQLDQRDIMNNPTTLDGGGNSEHVVTIIANFARLDGFTIRGGYTLSQSGAGIFVYDSKSTILANLIIMQNTSMALGGGLYIYNSDIIMLNCEIHDNRALQGGGMFVTLKSSTFQNIEIHDNVSDHDGGGVYIECNTAIFESVNIHHNDALLLDGAGMHNSRSYPTLNNCNIYDNILHTSSSSSVGCGLHDYDGISTLNNTSIINNTGSSNQYSYRYAGGIICTTKVTKSNPLALVGNKLTETTSLPAISLEPMQLHTYPNPVSKGNNITLVLENRYGYYQEEINIQVYTMDGRMVHQTTLAKGVNNFTLPDLTAGMYVINATIASGKRYNTQLVIH